MSRMYNPPHPGEVLKELYLEPLHLSGTEAAKGLCVSRKTLSALLNGHAGINSDMALKLAKAFNPTPESWLNHQQHYNLWHSEKDLDVSHVKVFYEPHVDK